MTRAGTGGAPELDSTHLTDEVGDEGGSPGDVERRSRPIGRGSQATELWRPDDTAADELPRDQAGRGRRSP